MMTLTGKTIILTGASSGIGRAVAYRSARSGINLVLNARRRDLLLEVAEKCAAEGVRVGHVVGSAADEEVCAEMVKTALSLGDFAGFIHAAGVANPGALLWELDHESFDEVFDASVKAGFLLARYAVPLLLDAGEGIAVYFGSGAAERNMPGLGAYSAAKAAEEHICRQLAAEASAVTSFVYRPGVVDTPMVRGMFRAEGGAAETVRREFENYRRQGEIIAPEKSADALIRILTNDPRRFHGKIARWSDAD